MGKNKRQAVQPQFGREKKQKGPQFIPLPEAGSDDDEVELSEEDLELLSSHHGDLDFLARLPKKDLDRAVSQVKAPGHKDAKQAQRQAKEKGEGAAGAAGGENADSEEDAEEYERRPRTSAQGEKELKPKGLPIKTMDGEVLYQRQAGGAQQGTAAAPAPSQLAVAGVTIQDDLAEALAREQQRREQEEEEEQRRAREAAEAARKAAARERAGKKGEAGAGGILGELAAYQDAEQRREAAKRSMAAAAQALLGDPEGRLGEVKPILELLADADPQVRRLAMLTGVAVFKDILPGYRIRPPTEKEAEVVVSKEVKRMREYEQALLRAYQALLKALLEAGQQAKSGKQSVQHGRIAVKCMATLLISLPHFNYTSDLQQALVPYMAHKDPQTRELAGGAIATLLSSDREGGVSVEAVQLVADLVRRRKCVVPPLAVQALLGLTFPEIGSAQEFEDAKRKRRGKAKRRKGSKDDVDKGFEEAQASASLEVRRGNQSLILEALFELFFRVLKSCTSSGLILQREGAPLPSLRFARKFPLLFPTLEGLSKYAHLISVEYFGDVMAVLQQLLESSALPPAERLRCLLTVAEILRGQGEALTVDRRSFYILLYSSLDHASLAPLLDEDEHQQAGDEGEGTEGQAAAAGGDKGATPAASSQEEQLGCLLCRLLERMILDSRLLDVTRQAAFAKRMAAAAGAAGDSGTAMGLLCVLHRMLRRQPKLRGMLENEAGGPSGYKSFSSMVEDPAEAGALAVPLWELSLLGAHFHPHVAQAARGVAAMTAADNSSGSSLLPLGTAPEQFAAQYSTATGGFRPAPTAGKQAGGSKRASKHAASAAAAAAAQPSLDSFLAAVESAAGAGSLFPQAALDQAGAGGPDLIKGAEAATSEQQQEQMLNGGECAAAEGEEIARALGRHFALARGFKRIAVLRREAALGRARVQRFRQHLQQQQQEEAARESEERRRAAAEKAKKKAGSKRKGAIVP